MKKSLNPKLLLLLLSILFTSMSCERDENGNRVTYYKTVGEGYIWDGVNNKPLKNVEIIVTSRYHKSSDCWFPPCATSETFTTDKNGYFKVRFAKRLNNEKIGYYKLSVFTGESLPFPPFYYYSKTNDPLLSQEYFCPEDIKNRKTIKFDTIKFYKYEEN